MKRKKTIFLKIVAINSNFDEKYYTEDPRSSIKPKWDKHKEIQTYTHHNQTVSQFNRSVTSDSLQPHE